MSQHIILVFVLQYFIAEWNYDIFLNFRFRFQILPCLICARSRLIEHRFHDDLLNIYLFEYGHFDPHCFGV